MLFQMMGDWGWWGNMMGSWGWPFAFAGGLFFFVALLAAIFWLWMLIDSLRRQDKDFPAKGAYDKVVWVLVIILLNLLGAVLYYFMVKSRRY